jgi:hypothetical protein
MRFDRGDYTLYVEPNAMGDWNVIIHKQRNTDPIHTTSFRCAQVTANYEICLAKAIDEAREIESERL